MASFLHGTGGLGIVNFKMFLRWTVYLEDFPCYATECRSKLMQSFSIELSLKLPEAFKGNNTADHIILFDKHPDMSTKIKQFYIFQETHPAKRKKKMIHLFPKLSHATILFWHFHSSSYTKHSVRAILLNPSSDLNKQMRKWSLLEKDFDRIQG